MLRSRLQHSACCLAQRARGLSTQSTQLVAWGAGSFGAVGDGTYTTRHQPTVVPLPGEVRACVTAARLTVAPGVVDRSRLGRFVRIAQHRRALQLGVAFGLPIVAFQQYHASECPFNPAAAPETPAGLALTEHCGADTDAIVGWRDSDCHGGLFLCRGDRGRCVGDVGDEQVLY